MSSRTGRAKGLSTPTVKALRILAKASAPLGPRDFAAQMWPTSAGWQRRSKRGIVGVGMPMRGGVMLMRLSRRGFVAVLDAEPKTRLYALTTLGASMLLQDLFP